MGRIPLELAEERPARSPRHGSSAMQFDVALTRGHNGDRVPRAGSAGRHPTNVETKPESHYAGRMGKGRMAGLGRLWFWAALLLIAALVVAQSAVHLVVVLHFHRLGSFVDLDRSNGLPDIVSTVALGLAALGASAVARAGRGAQRASAWLLGALLTGLMLADLFHDGAHPSSAKGWNVIVLVAVTAGLLGLVALPAGTRVRLTLVVVALLLALVILRDGASTGSTTGSSASGETRRASTRSSRRKASSCFGWSLVALALWDEALRRRRALVAVAYSASFSSTGSIETTCRLKRSSESDRPAATPISCERCRIGIWKSFPVCFLSFDCQASSERWQSGHGVTIASAPGLLRLLDRLDQLAERRVLARLDDREAAALDLRRVVDRLAAAGGDDPLERVGPVGVVEAHQLRRPEDLAAVERRDLEARGAPCARPPGAAGKLSPATSQRKWTQSTSVS